MNGIICINKPMDFTSFDVVAKSRGILRTKKIGHSGTLDPMATGVLPLFVGRATKAIDLLPDHDKRYTAIFLLGKTTDTQDITGTVLTNNAVTCTTAQVEQAVADFVGENMQLPPMYSAVKINGKRLYDLARQGIEVERTPRPVTFHHIDIISADACEYTIDVSCSKGGYIRTLCHDIGEKLGCGAVLTSLCRTQACGFNLADCVTLEQLSEIAQNGKLQQLVLPIEKAFANLPQFKATPQQMFCLRNGVPISLDGFADFEHKNLFCVYTQDRLFVGIAQFNEQDSTLKMKKTFTLEDSL